MSAYRVELRPAAVRALRRLDPPIQKRVHAVKALLAAEASTRNCSSQPPASVTGPRP